MSQFAVDVEIESEDNSVRNNFVPFVITASKNEVKSIDKTVLSMGIVLIVLQVVDGILTGYGVSKFGLGAEANNMMRNFMHLVGFVPALIISKMLAISIVSVACRNAKNCIVMRCVLSFLIAYYSLIVVSPWIYILGEYIFS